MCQGSTQNPLQAGMLLVLLQKREILPLSFPLCPSAFIYISYVAENKIQHIF
jgi:hypothetical protein